MLRLVWTCKSAITHRDLFAKVLTAALAHQGCEHVKEIATTALAIVTRERLGIPVSAIVERRIGD
jgi:hypothetical protein